MNCLMKDTALDYLFVCVGTGGVISGSALAQGEWRRDAQQSMEQGGIYLLHRYALDNCGWSPTQCIRKLTTFAIMKKHVVRGSSDEVLVDNMRLFGKRMKK
jgi:hypothetical protein